MKGVLLSVKYRIMTLRLLFQLTLLIFIFSSCKGEKPSAKAIAPTEMESGIQNQTEKSINDIPKEQEMVEAKPLKAALPSTPDNGKAAAIPTKPTKAVVKDKKPTKQPTQQTATVEPKPRVIDQPLPETPPAATTPTVKEPATTIVPETKPTPATDPVPVPAPPFNHELWDMLLQKYVSASGKVNYKGFKGDEAKLKKYLVALEENAPDASWRRAEAMSYWLNVYNAFTIKLIIDNYPVNSIQDIAGGKPWDKEWINLGGKTYSLNHIENKIIRPTYKDARIHFAVNCAAKSCPTLFNRAFTPEKLERQLATLTKTFVNNKAFNQLSENKAVVSKIFEWYAEDFGDLKSFLNKYSAVKIGDGVAITFNEYDWGLNE